MSKTEEDLRICSSGSPDPESDDLDDFTTAHIRRFCETIEVLLAGEKSEEPEDLKTKAFC